MKPFKDFITEKVITNNKTDDGGTVVLESESGSCKFVLNKDGSLIITVNNETYRADAKEAQVVHDLFMP